MTDCYEVNPKLERMIMFHTPGSFQELLDWIECQSGAERAVAYAAAGMAWNLASDLVANAEASDTSELKGDLDGKDGDLHPTRGGV